MSYSEEINTFIIKFNYKSIYYDYFKGLSLTTKQKSKKMYYECINDFVSNFNVSIPAFSDFICQKVTTSTFKDEVELYKNADIDRKRWSDLINNKSERPNKDSLFKLAISLKLSIDDTDTLLATKGYCIAPNRYRDKVLSYFFIDSDGRKILDLNPIDRNDQINSLLEEMHQAPIY